MPDLADILSDTFLPRVVSPSQYVGGEINACRPDLDDAEVMVAMAFPDAYTVGISHLGSQVLYRHLNSIEGVACDRTYCPLPDAEAVLREHAIPLFGWETRRALGDFDVIGFSLSYELCVTNVLTMLDLAGIPLRAADRTADHPLIVGGDALADAPEPVAPFFDVLLPGDGEQPLARLVEIVRRAKREGLRREELLECIAREMDGAYVPALYDSRVDADGRFAGLTPRADDLPTQVSRSCLRVLGDSPLLDAPLVPLAEGVHERVVLEIMRGCANACRFCQAGATRLPVRVRPVDEIVTTALQALDNTGYREVALLSLSTSDYPYLDELIDRLDAALTPRHASISLPSLRVDKQLRYLPRLTSNVRKGGLTIAAEAGSDRLRRSIRKNITEADMLEGVTEAWRAGYQHVKVYFMAGLPGETPEDIDAIFHLCRRLADTRKAVDGRKGTINASVSWFVPKPHTPLQWAPMRDAEYFWSVRNRLRDLCHRQPVNVKFHHIETSGLEGMIARGDRRVADVIQAAWNNGARMDSWHEHFRYEVWEDAFARTGLHPSTFWAELAPDAPLPWAHIRCHRGPDFLHAERQRAIDALQEPPSQ